MLQYNVLVVVDMQNDFLTGALKNDEAVKIIPNIKKKIDSHLTRNDIVFFTLDTHSSWDYVNTLEGRKLPIPHCIENHPGWELTSDLWVPPGLSNVRYVKKHSFGYPHWREEFMELNVEPAHIELVGVCTDICVVSNALILKALYPEVEIAVDASCCAGLTPEKHLAALQTMQSCQVNVTNM